MQHLFCQNTPVIYDRGDVKEAQVDYKIWNAQISKYVHTVIDNYKIKLFNTKYSVFAWKPMVVFIGASGNILSLEIR